MRFEVVAGNGVVCFYGLSREVKKLSQLVRDILSRHLALLISSNWGNKRGSSERGKQKCQATRTKESKSTGVSGAAMPVAGCSLIGWLA